MVTGWDNRHRATTTPGQLRASDADREQVIELLKGAFIRGQLAKDELAERVAGALTSRTYAELAVLTADIPAAAAAEPAPPERTATKTSPRLSRQAKAGAWAIGSCVVMVVSAGLSNGRPNDAMNLLYVLCVMMFIASFITFAVVHFTQEERTADGQSGQRPAAPGGSGGTAQGEAHAPAAAKTLPPTGPARRDGAETRRIQRTRRPHRGGLTSAPVAAQGAA